MTIFGQQGGAVLNNLLGKMCNTGNKYTVFELWNYSQKNKGHVDEKG